MTYAIGILVVIGLVVLVAWPFMKKAQRRTDPREQPVTTDPHVHPPRRDV
jgi:hypothetical protein